MRRMTGYLTLFSLIVVGAACSTPNNSNGNANTTVAASPSPTATAANSNTNVHGNMNASEHSNMNMANHNMSPKRKARHEIVTSDLQQIGMRVALSQTSVSVCP